MDAYTHSSDGTKIHYELTGSGRTALLFAHGWLGSARWWDSQAAFFARQHQVVTVDLAGHGKSERTRKTWSARHFAEDMKAVADRIDADEVVLVGHSMSGAYVLEASLLIGKTSAIVLVDTLKDLEQLPSPEQVQAHLALYRKDFKSAVEDFLPRYLFADTTPPLVRARVLGEFLQADPELAVSVIEALYRMDVREAAKRVSVPVRAINSDGAPTNLEGNRRCFRDFDFQVIAGVGHYPMLEKPEEFNRALAETLGRLGTG